MGDFQIFLKYKLIQHKKNKNIDNKIVVGKSGEKISSKTVTINTQNYSNTRFTIWMVWEGLVMLDRSRR